MTFDTPVSHASKRVLPSLFGRLTAVWLDHGELTALLPRIEEMCRLLDAGGTDLPPALHPARLAENLSARLVRHFEAEEASGYFTTMVREEPALLPTIVALKADHVAMLDETRALARMAGDVGQWEELSARARRLVRFLREHEAAEADLMRRFLSEYGAPD